MVSTSPSASIARYVVERDITEIEHDVTLNGKNEAFAVCLQLSVKYSENTFVFGE